MSNVRAPSAGDHEYRQIRVDIYPSATGGLTSVRLRRNRGADLLWDRRLGEINLPACADGAVATGASVMRAAAAALLAAAHKMDGL